MINKKNTFGLLVLFTAIGFTVYTGRSAPAESAAPVSQAEQALAGMPNADLALQNDQIREFIKKTGNGANPTIKNNAEASQSTPTGPNAPQTVESPTPPENIKYQNPFVGIAFNYPSEWGELQIQPEVNELTSPASYKQTDLQLDPTPDNTVILMSHNSRNTGLGCSFEDCQDKSTHGSSNWLITKEDTTYALHLYLDNNNSFKQLVITSSNEDQLMKIAETFTDIPQQELL